MNMQKAQKKHKPDPIYTPIYIVPLPNISHLITFTSFHKHNTNTSLSLLSLSTYLHRNSQIWTNKLSYKNLSIPQFTYKITLFSNPSRFLHSFSDTNPNFSLIKSRFVFLTTLYLIHRTKSPNFNLIHENQYLNQNNLIWEFDFENPISVDCWFTHNLIFDQNCSFLWWDEST